MIDSDEIRKKIASVNEAILTRFVEILTEQNEVLLKKLQAAQVQGLAEAKATGGRVITDASNYVREQVKAAVEEALGKGEAQIKRDLAGSRKALHTLRKTAVIAAAVSCICTVATVAVAINVF